MGNSLTIARVDGFGVNISRAEFEAIKGLAADVGSDTVVGQWLATVQRQVEAASDPGQVCCCSECGELHIEATAWVRVNGDMILDRDPPSDTVWCPACEADTDMVTLDAYNEDRDG